MMAVPIAKSADGLGLQPGTAVPLFQTRVAGGTRPGNMKHQYAVSAHGQRFLVNVPQQRSTPTPLTVVVNWQAAARRSA